MFDLGVKKQTTHAGVIYVLFDTWIPASFQKGLVSNGDYSGERVKGDITRVPETWLKTRVFENSDR